MKQTTFLFTFFSTFMSKIIISQTVSICLIGKSSMGGFTNSLENSFRHFYIFKTKFAEIETNLS